MTLPSASVMRPSVSPWQYTLSHTCHAKKVEPTGRPGIYPTPLSSAYCPTPAMQKRWSPRDARAYIRFLGSAYYPISATQNIYCPMAATQKRRNPRDARIYIQPFANIHYPIPTIQKRQNPRDGKAYTQPLNNTHYRKKGESQSVYPIPS